MVRIATSRVWLVLSLFLSFVALSLLRQAQPVWGESDSSIGAGYTLSSGERVVAGNQPATLRINEVSFLPATGEPQWVELKNHGAAPVNIRNYGITDQDGNWYRIPHALPPVPPGGLVLILFDGEGSDGDDYDFSDNVVTLHTPPGLTNIFEMLDQVAVYDATSSQGNYLLVPLVMRQFASFNPSLPNPMPRLNGNPLVHFVAWGGVPGAEEQADAVARGIWPENLYLDTNQKPGRDALRRGGSIGVPGNLSARSPGDWTFYPPDDTSRGAENPLPVPFFRNPPDGATVCAQDPDSPGLNLVTFGWSAEQGVAGYHLEIDDDPAFGSPLTSVEVEHSFYTSPSGFSPGTFYYRVRALAPGGGAGSYSAPKRITFIECRQAAPRNSQENGAIFLGVIPVLQHKDTGMLNLDGDPALGSRRWDAAHESDGDAMSGNGVPVRISPLDNAYATHASIAMLVAYHGGNLSMDRIAFEAFGGGAPEGDLGYGIGLWPNEQKIRGGGKNILDWAMNDNPVISARGKPSPALVQQWLREGRPMLVIENDDSHSVVLDGYREVGGIRLAHRVDPWTATGAWIEYSTWNITEYHVPPAGVIPRSDEDVDGDAIADTVDDSDRDGAVDFDERERFSLVPNSPDSDNDRVRDGADIYEYLFDSVGAYDPRPPDIDGDGLRKERDNDNDRRGDPSSALGIGLDGCEDANLNGIHDPRAGETSNFDPADDMILHIRMEWSLHGSDVDLHLIKPGGTFNGPGDLHWAEPNPDWGEPGVPCDNPTLDLDCIADCTVEQIRVPSLEAGVYTVRVHYYNDYDLGSTAPRVSIWFKGVRRDYSPTTMSEGGLWDVAAITWPSGRIEPLNSSVTTGNGDVARPAKQAPP